MSTMASEAKTTGYKEQFIDLLNNKTKAREKGFTVLVKGRLELAEFKNLCREQMYNHCLTAHYKLNPETAVGTLLKAFLEDLTKIGRENPDTTGNFYPDPKTSFDSWGKRVEPILKRLMSLNEMTRNSFDRSMVAEIAGIVGNPKTLEKGDRLVLLAELESILDDPGEWAKFFELVFNNLPERVGIVISGVPDYYFLPTIEPHIIQLTLPPEEESPVPDKDSPTKSKFKTPSFLSDSAAAEDKLGVLDLASGMAKLVLHKETKPPLVIGIHGPWGKGKSTFMQLIDQQLAKEAAQDVVTVTFNAWQFEDSKQIWAGLAHVVSKKLESMMNPWYKFWMPIVHSFQKRKRELIINSGFLLLTVIVTVLIFIANPTILTGLDNKSEAVKLVKLVVAGGTPLLGFWILASKIKKLFQPINKKLMEYIRMPDYKDQMGFQHEVMRDLSMVEKYLRKQKPNCKTVIYIDDLDRCSEEKIMEILQAINLILANSNFFVFVGMDTKMIRRAIRNNYGNKNIEADFPQKYLEKILQLSFHLPEISKEQRFNFVRDLFSAAAREKYEEKKTGTTGEGGDEQETPKPPPEPGKLFFNLTHAHKPVTYAVTEVEDTADELEAFNAYRYYLQDNPRELKRLVNIHRLVKILIHQDRELSWDAEKQQKFVKWTIFCSRWPKLVKKAIDKAKAPFPNCLKAIADGNTELQEFAGNQTGLLSSADIDADFIFAADIMQRIHHHAE